MATTDSRRSRGIDQCPPAASSTGSRQTAGIEVVSTKLRILIAPDKFKGCLNALGVANAIRSGIESYTGDGSGQVTILPLADGGDGSVDAAIAAGSQARQSKCTAKTERSATRR